MNEYQADLFEDVKNESGCMYISDIKTGPGRMQAIRAMCAMDLTPYPMSSIEDMADYLFGEKVTFADYAQAHCYFTRHQ